MGIFPSNSAVATNLKGIVEYYSRLTCWYIILFINASATGVQPTTKYGMYKRSVTSPILPHLLR